MQYFSKFSSFYCSLIMGSTIPKKSCNKEKIKQNCEKNKGKKRWYYENNKDTKESTKIYFTDPSMKEKKRKKIMDDIVIEVFLMLTVKNLKTMEKTTIKS